MEKFILIDEYISLNTEQLVVDINTNKRKFEISFRNLENQLEPFLEEIKK